LLEIHFLTIALCGALGQLKILGFGWELFICRHTFLLFFFAFFIIFFTGVPFESVSRFKFRTKEIICITICEISSPLTVCLYVTIGNHHQQFLTSGCLARKGPPEVASASLEKLMTFDLWMTCP